MNNLFEQHKATLPDDLRYGVLRTEVLEHPGLYGGKLGMAILFYSYSRYAKDPLYERFADEVVDSVLELSNELPMRFSDGLTGIGWGITYLLREEFIAGDIDEILSEIDSVLEKGKLFNDAGEIGYQTYQYFRSRYKNPDIRLQLPEGIYMEGEVLRLIWDSCLSRK